MGSVSEARAAEPWGEARTFERGPRGEATFRGLGAAIDERGYVVAVWQRGEEGETVAARRTPRRRFGGTFTLFDKTVRASSPAVAFDGGRRAAALGVLDEGAGGGDGVGIVGARVVRPNGSRSGTQRLGRALGLSLALRPSPAGDPLFTFPGPAKDTNGVSRLVRVQDGRFETTTARLPVAAALAGEPDGGVLAAFTVRDDPEGPRVILARRPAGGGTFVFAGQVPTKAAPQGLELAVGADGTAAVAWDEAIDRRHRLMVATRRPGEAFGASDELVGDERIGVADLAVTDRGRVVVAWSAGGRDVDPSKPVNHAFLAVLGEGQTHRLSRGRVHELEVEPDARGGASVLLSEGPGAIFGGPVRAAAITPSGRLGKIQRLTARGEEAMEAALAVGPRGDALALWYNPSGRLRAARRPV